MHDVELDDFVSQVANSYAVELKAQSEIGVFFAPAHELFVESVYGDQVFPPQRKVAAMQAEIRRLVENWRNETVFDDPGFALQAQAHKPGGA